MEEYNLVFSISVESHQKRPPEAVLADARMKVTFHCRTDVSTEGLSSLKLDEQAQQ